jgi:hypothetical protein
VALVLMQFASPVAIDLWRGRFLQSRVALQGMIDVSEGDSVVCRVEQHPLVVHDATRLWHHWQWAYYLHRPRVRRQLGDLAGTIIRKRPAIVLDRDRISPPLPEHLYAEGLISEAEALQLEDFLEANYQRIQLDHPDPVWLWIRRDRVDRMPPDMVLQGPEVVDVAD